MTHMSDRFRPLDTTRLAEWIADELEHADTVFGIPREHFFVPSPVDRVATVIRRKRIETPIGVAAGPHTHLAQNIIAAWLCGARVIELKTVQTLDRIEVNKPCIDMQDEGTNIEWSQELEVRQSFSEYLRAWVLIHALHARLGLPGSRPGVIFDLSVGYDLAGLRQPNMRWFFEHMIDASDELERSLREVESCFPEVRDLAIPARLVDSVTLSTLHGCPADEIGDIVEHLIADWRLHAAVKLNPTLLGYETVHEILVESLGWRHLEPHRPAFDTDATYPQALTLLDRLATFGRSRNLEFGVKLCNTLPVVNQRPVFPGTDQTPYLSGRPLHALAVELARRVTEDTNGSVPISFAGGADAFNTPTLLACGLAPVTLCSDLLRPGGYLRLRQLLDEIDGAMKRAGAANLDQLILLTAGDGSDPVQSARRNLERYAAKVRDAPELRRDSCRRGHTKTSRALGLFDCVEAPCTDACGVDQRVPEYMRRVAAGDIPGAAVVIAEDNPLPSILGRACHHPCEPVCLRTHLDEPVAIREIKRFVTDHAPSPVFEPVGRSTTTVAIVGAGPCGLAAATSLVRAGVRVTVFEARPQSGGMVSATIPGYRASPSAVRRDLERVERLGATFHFGIAVGPDLSLGRLLADYDWVVVAAGAQGGLPLGIDNEFAEGVLDGLAFLRAVRRGERPDLGLRVGVIGGGDVAIDCARSARRLTDGAVEILYRRTVEQMPAHPDEIDDLSSEGIAIRELVSPRSIVVGNGRVAALICDRMQLGDVDDSGRRGVTARPGFEVTVELDSLIVAIGQRPDLGLFSGYEVETSGGGYVVVDTESRQTSVARVFAGGDLVAPGPSNIVDACADGQRIAHAILARCGVAGPPPSDKPDRDPDRRALIRRRALRRSRASLPRSTEADELGFVEVIGTLDPEAARREASRCLDCDLMCSTCDSVCPNRAIATYALSTGDGATVVEQRLQVAVLADFCNECGNCVAFCPTAGKPWRDKPRITFHRPDFEGAADNAFMMIRHDGELLIQGRFGGETHQLRVRDRLVWDAPGRHERLNRDELGSMGSGSSPAATLFTLHRGLTESMPFLPYPEAVPSWILSAD
jgi:putative selenate reductase